MLPGPDVIDAAAATMTERENCSYAKGLTYATILDMLSLNGSMTFMGH
jgi:hypothetical protein